MRNLTVKFAFNRFAIRNLTLIDLFISESCIEINIELNFYFHTSLWCLKQLSVPSFQRGEKNDWGDLKSFCYAGYLPWGLLCFLSFKDFKDFQR